MLPKNLGTVTVRTYAEWIPKRAATVDPYVSGPVHAVAGIEEEIRRHYRLRLMIHAVCKDYIRYSLNVSEEIVAESVENEN